MVHTKIGGTVMREIKLKELLDTVILSDIKDDVFIGFETHIKFDSLGEKYEIRGTSENYYKLGKILEETIYVSETHMFNMLLSEKINEISSGEIYSHGYPESRLIPSTHMRDCQEAHLDNLLCEFEEKISSIVSENYVDEEGDLMW